MVRHLPTARTQAFPVGASATLEELDRDPHRLLARLRDDEPVSWLPELGGWLVTRYADCLRVMRDASVFTVDDARFSTARVVGPSMLSLDGDAHARHRGPFSPAFRLPAVRERFTAAVRDETVRLVDELAPSGHAELRRAFAGPLAASIVTRALGLDRGEAHTVLGWYDAIVAAVTQITAGADPAPAGAAAFAALRSRLEEVISASERSSLLAAVAADGNLGVAEIVSNAAVLLFGGIETTEGMIANAILLLLEHPDELAAVRRVPDLVDAAVEESLRMEPAAAIVDRYATEDVEIGSASIARGDLVRVSITAANRDPAAFTEPDRYTLSRPSGRAHVAFAHGPHVCVGVHLARLEARMAVASLLARLPDLRPDPARPASVRGLVFRKPPALHVIWTPPAG